MAAAQCRDNKMVPEGTKLAIDQKNPSYTVMRVAFWAFFFFLMQVFLAYCVYRFTISEMQIRTEAFREEVLKIFADKEFKIGHKLERRPPPITAASRRKRNVGLTDSDHNKMELLSCCQKMKDFCPQIPGHNSTPASTGMAESTTSKTGGTNGRLIPPVITESQNGSSDLISANEGETVQLFCSATGSPAPRIMWQRLDGKPINGGMSVHDVNASAALNPIKVNRDDTGKYFCTADNGVPPAAKHTFDLEVNFLPEIKIVNPVVEVANGSTAVLECDVEAFPEPISYWELSDGTLLQNDQKFRIFKSEVRDRYKYKMQLNIINVAFDDMKYQYRCYSKSMSKMNITTGEIQLRVLDSNTFNQTRDRTSPSPVTEVLPTIRDRPYGNVSYQTDNLTRTADWVVHYIGKPNFQRFSRVNYGCWMTDARPVENPECVWVTHEAKPNELFEYRTDYEFMKNLPSSSTKFLEEPFSGNSQAVYNGFFFYHIKGTNRIVKYNLKDKSTKYMDLPGDMNRRSKLYSRQHNYVDFCVDENGLWLIFAVEDSINTAVMKVDYENMTPQYAWNITLEHTTFGEMFIVCGVLYAVDSVTAHHTKIGTAFDLYKHVPLNVNLNFTNQFNQTTMLSYNYKAMSLYSWDDGNQLTYRVLFNDFSDEVESSTKT